MLKCVLSPAVMISLVAILAASAHASLVTPRAPGGVFVEGQPVVFDINDASGRVSYRVENYFGIVEMGKQAPAGAKEINIGVQPPGWYTIHCSDQAGATAVPFVVVIDRGRKPLPEKGRVCADAASAWLIRDEARRKTFARMIRLAGIPWVRERLSWPDTEPARGRIDWAHYQNVADTLNAEGIRICQVFHQTPDWARGSSPDERPTDLRDLYSYLKTAAAHFRKQIAAWEIWNEIDIHFWSGLGDSYAGMQKAAYLAIKAGNPDALVLQSSISHLAWEKSNDRAAHVQVETLYSNGVGDYFDIFNWHSYLQPNRYAGMLRDHRAWLARHRCAPRQEWLTECGMPLQANPEVRVLTRETQSVQCRFVTRSIATGLAAGTERYFWFVTPDYMEGEGQYGLLRPDLAPYPGFAALSAAANILAEADYVGPWRAKDDPIVAYAFKTPDGNVTVAWSDGPAEFTVQSYKPYVEIADCFGARSKAPTKDGRATVKVGPEAVYVFGIGLPAAVKDSVRYPQREQRLPANNPSKVVLVGRCDLPVDRNGEAAYRLALDAARKPFEYTVEVYNFDESRAASGAVEVLAPTDWQVGNAKRNVGLQPMGREVLRFTITPAPGSGEVRVSAWGKFGSPAASPTVSRIVHESKETK